MDAPKNKTKPYTKNKNRNNKVTRGKYRNTGGRFTHNLNSDDDRDLPQSSFPNSQNSCKEVFVFDSNTALGPYQAWKVYLPWEAFDESSALVKKLKIIENFLRKIVDTKRNDIEKRKCFSICVKTLCSDEDFISSWPDFLNELQNTPRQVISCFGLSMHHIIHQEMMENFPPDDPLQSQDEIAEELEVINSLPMMHVRFTGFGIMPLKNLKTNMYKKFVSVKGTIVRSGDVRPLCTKLVFKCNRCQTEQVILQPSGNYTMPNRCLSKTCQCRSFQPLLSSPKIEMVPWQTIRLQELSSDEHCERGRIPRFVECELTHDLVDKCIVGDIVTVSGIVKANDSKKKSFGGKLKRSSYTLYILANSIECLKEQQSDFIDKTPGGVQLSLSDFFAIRHIYEQHNLFCLIVASLCPNIYGHEIVKAGLILSLFGGIRRYLGMDNRVPVRGDSHVLIVGDPGLGKSQMLLACANVSPRGIYVCGNTTTSSGLTVTVTKDSNGETSLDAGALILADQGTCCIDEFDKMTKQHRALLEAMEQQSISIAKAGISCSLPARTSVIAAANPVDGHYNKAKTVAENIKLGSALLSRFDLVFIVIDKADAEHDERLSTHVMEMHKKGTSSTVLSVIPKSELLVCNDSGTKIPLIDALRSTNYEPSQIIPPGMLRKYIAYARKYVHPKLSNEAAAILQDFYLELRREHQNSNSIPITNRQLESMIRLTEARARSELREECTADDAEEVVEIIKLSMIDIFSDEFGTIDFDRSMHGSGMSKLTTVKMFLQVITKVAARNHNSYFTVQQLENIAHGAKIDGVRDLIEKLNEHGYLIKKGPKLYQLFERQKDTKVDMEDCFTTTIASKSQSVESTYSA